MFPQYRPDVSNGSTIERRSRDCWKPDATMKAPECTGAEGVKSSHHSPRAEKPGGAAGSEGAGNGERKLSLRISRFAEKPFFFF